MLTRASFLLLTLVLLGCDAPRAGVSPLLPDQRSGYEIGAWVSDSVLSDPAFLRDRRLKISLRNNTGNPLFNPEPMRQKIRKRMTERGYLPADGIAGFGLKMDINIVSASHITTDYAEQFALLTGISLAAAQPVRSTDDYFDYENRQSGIFSGAALGYLAGQYLTQNTYVVRAHVQLGFRDQGKRNRKIMTFSRSERVESYDEWNAAGYETWLTQNSIDVVVYAGGPLTGPNEIAAIVRQRLGNILADIL